MDDGEVDSEAAAAFVRYAASDAPRALLIPAQREVDAITELIDDSGADGDTEVPHADDQPLNRYVDEVEARHPRRLAGALEGARGGALGGRPQEGASSISFSSRLSTLPVALRGSSSRNQISRGTLKFARFFLT